MLDKETLSKMYLDAIMDMSNSGMEIERVSQAKNMLALYLRMFKEMPNFISTDYDNLYFGLGDKDTPYDDMDPYKTLKNIEDKFTDNCYCIRNFDTRVLVMDHLIMCCDEDSIYGVGNILKFPEEFEQCIVKASKDNTKYMSYVTSSGNGFNTMDMEVHHQECDIQTNYNDDLRYEAIEDFINGDESGLIIMYGMPGTGKTHLLRHLIYSTDKDFIFIDSSCFNYITDASFVKLLIQNKDAVIVLEDCEDILKDRIAGNNKLSALLNLSDGILGDSLNLKFICTFNAQLRNIDDAVLRKGRLKLKYEFKALTPDKTQALAKKLGKDIPEGKSLPLCEIYNYGEDNGAKETATKRPIGFNI